MIDEALKHSIPVIGHMGQTSWLEAARLGIDHLAHAVDWSSKTLTAEARKSYLAEVLSMTGEDAALALALERCGRDRSRPSGRPRAVGRKSTGEHRQYQEHPLGRAGRQARV